MDFLSNSEISLCIYYTCFPDRGFNTPAKTSEEVVKLFSIKALPFKNAKKTVEIDVGCIK